MSALKYFYADQLLKQIEVKKLQFGALTEHHQVTLSFVTLYQGQTSGQSEKLLPSFSQINSPKKTKCFKT